MREAKEMSCVLLRGRPANSFARIHVPAMAVADPPNPDDCVPARRFCKTNITPARPNKSIILSNQFSFVGSISPGFPLTSVPYSTERTPIRSGSRGFASIFVPASMVIPMVLGSRRVHFIAGSAWISCGMDGIDQRAC